MRKVLMPLLIWAGASRIQSINRFSFSATFFNRWGVRVWPRNVNSMLLTMDFTSCFWWVWHLTLIRLKNVSLADHFDQQPNIFANLVIAARIMKEPDRTSTRESRPTAITICDDNPAALPRCRRLNICAKDCSVSIRPPSRPVPAGYENALTSSLSRRSNHWSVVHRKVKRGGSSLVGRLNRWMGKEGRKREKICHTKYNIRRLAELGTKRRRTGGKKIGRSIWKAAESRCRRSR